MGRQEASTGAHSTIIIPIEINFKYPQIKAQFLGRRLAAFFCRTAMTHLEREFKDTDTSHHSSTFSAEHSTEDSTTVQLHSMNILTMKHKGAKKAVSRTQTA